MTLSEELGALDPLLRELAVPRQVIVQSDDKLCRQLTAKDYPADAKPGVEPVPGIHGSWPVAPAAILMELAEASAPPLIPPGLRDLSLRWAWLRYCWSFAPGRLNEKLKLSAAAWSLAQHHKQVSADQLGVGFALEMTRRALENIHGGATTVHDADLVIDGTAPSVWGFTHGGGLRPDYFIEVQDPSPGREGSKVYVLECKGTHSGAQRGQLRKGLRQVMAVADENGNPFPGIVCSTGFTKTRTTLRMVDPDEDPEGGFLAPAADRDARAEVRSGKGWVRIGNPPAFRRELAQLESAGLLSFAGQYEDAQELLPARMRRRGHDIPVRNGESSPWQILDRPATGTRFSLPLADGRRLQVVAAVDEEMLSAARQDSPAALSVARRQFAERRLGRIEGANTLEGDGPPLLIGPDARSLQIVGRSGQSLTLAIA